MIKTLSSFVNVARVSNFDSSSAKDNSIVPSLFKFNNSVYKQTWKSFLIFSSQKETERIKGSINAHASPNDFAWSPFRNAFFSFIFFFFFFLRLRRAEQKWKEHRGIPARGDSFRRRDENQVVGTWSSGWRRICSLYIIKIRLLRLGGNRVTAYEEA